MATTQDNIDQGEKDFAEAFNGGPSDGAAKPADAGLDPAAASTDAPADAAPVAADATATEEASPSATPMDAGEDDQSGDVPSEDPAKEKQRLKSWEGRLKKMEAELKAKASATGDTEQEVAGDALDDVADAAEDAGEAGLADEAGELAGQVERGEISVDDAMKALVEDFGEPFVKMIEAIARKVAGEAATEKVGELDKRTQEIIDHIKDRDTRAHFQAIAKAHPDFNEVRQDPAFEAWVAEDPARTELVAGGSADDLIALLTEFKSSGKAGATDAEAAQADKPAAAAPAAIGSDDADEADLDAAEGIPSSGGLELPEEPASGASDYAGAWDELDRAERKTKA